MNLKKCESGHFYDAEKYDSCPYCGADAVQSGGKEAGNPSGYPCHFDPPLRNGMVYAAPPLPDPRK